jgi:Na+/melibiose symporter-like transporter
VDKDWRLITGFAILGFVLAALIFFYINFVGEFDGDLYTAFAVLCPPALLCFPFSEVMKDKSGLYAIWSLIGFLNSGLYAVIGAAVVGLRKRPRAKSD